VSKSGNVELQSEVASLSGSASHKLITLEKGESPESIDWDNPPRELWAQGKGYGTSNSDVYYNPRKYFEHTRFNVDIGFGDFQLHLPNEYVRGETQSTEGVMVMSWVSDHFGGTVKMNCKDQK
jgi:hypothetical protein